MDNQPWVYIGPWTDWSQGRIYGGRFTLSNVSSIYLIAFLAIFVRLAGAHFWSIFRYVYFQIHATDKPRDGLYHEQQVLLRNSPYDTDAIWQFVRVAFAWRKHVPGALRRTLGLILYACFHVLIFTAAGIFVSNVATTNSGVLLRGDICGTWINPFAFKLYTQFSAHDIEARNRWQGWHTEIVKTAATFSQQCYNTTEATTSLANCKAYGPGLLKWTLNTNVSCPFDPKMCLDNTAISFDSGLLDSQYDFGINSQHNRVKYRTVLDCAPIVQEGYRSELLSPSQVDIAYLVSTGLIDVVQEEQFREFYYGESWYFNTSATYIWNNISFGIPTGNMALARYLLDVENSVLGNLESGTFNARPELNRTDADVVLFFLLSNTAYLNDVNDPWFKATRQRNISQLSVEEGGQLATVTLRLQDNNASVMACTQQHQFCNGDASRCSQLTGGASPNNKQAMLDFARDLDLNPQETAIQQRLYRAAWNNWIYQTSGYLQGSGLLASQIGSSSVAPRLPDNQWVLELQSWFATGLTGIQMELTAYVTGLKDTTSNQYITPPSGDDEAWMCGSQIVQRDGYTNISGLGVALIVVIGAVIIAVDLVLHRAVKAVRSAVLSWNGNQGECHGIRQWDEMEALQLMRVAYQSNGAGEWRGKLGHVPVTQGEQEFKSPCLAQGLKEESSVGSWTLPGGQGSGSESQSYSYSYSSSNSKSNSRLKHEQDVKNGLAFEDSIDPTDDGVVR